MSDTTATNVQPAAAQPVQSPVFVVAEGQARVGRLLAGLQDSAPATDQSVGGDDTKFENQLALVRLGMATSLFYALRTKHSPTAAHCLRVALSCSAWAKRLGLDEATRDRVEVAALLHDLGKIGIPDRVLRKPGKLSVDEQLTMDCCAQLGCEILRGCTGDSQLLDTVLYANNWYDSRRDGEGPRGDALPLGSRMIAIADAFDAMTTDTVYRPAMSRERAIQELIGGSCSQFDPELAIDFNRMLEQRPEILQGVIVDRWLQQLQTDSGDTLWTSANAVGRNHGEQVRRESLFFRQLIGNMKDGVVFTDPEGTITQWNTVMQRLTAIASDAMVGQNWSSECVRLREQDATRTGESCLVRDCLATGSVVARPMLMEQPGADPTPVHVQVSPVVGLTPGIHGTVILVRDLSDQTSLEEQLESLHHQTTRDQLTGVANRAHFDEVLRQLTETTAVGGPSFSLIICDIDHFKRVNDVHGHPAGDDALVSFASILTSHSRDDDLVARYGGEEFLLLAPNCDNATAARRAEAIRQALERTPLPSIGGTSVTASFGVTEFQSGDSAETVLSRADRALLKAKDNGRNRVIQLGTGNQINLAEPHAKRGWLSWFNSDGPPQEQEFDVITPVPIDLAIEKLRGFIADQKAEIINVNENHVSLKLRAICTIGGRRRVDHHIALRVQLTLSEVRQDAAVSRNPCKTNVHISLQPIRNRDRRGSELSTCIAQVVMSLRSYLMGEIRRPARG
jgi:diguanylate cyclase (GGDEF)-like protein/PAS domain S-box-containing protein